MAPRTDGGYSQTTYRASPGSERDVDRIEGPEAMYIGTYTATMTHTQPPQRVGERRFDLSTDRPFGPSVSLYSGEVRVRKVGGCDVKETSVK